MLSTQSKDSALVVIFSYYSNTVSQWLKRTLRHEKTAPSFHHRTMSEALKPVLHSTQQDLHVIMNLTELRVSQPFTKTLKKETYIKHLKLLSALLHSAIITSTLTFVRYIWPTKAPLGSITPALVISLTAASTMLPVTNFFILLSLGKQSVQ